MTVFTGGGEDTDTEERPGEDTGRGWSDVATSRGAGAGGRKDPPLELQRKFSPAGTSAWTSGLQACERGDGWCSSPPAGGHLLRQPQDTQSPRGDPGFVRKRRGSTWPLSVGMARPDRHFKESCCVTVPTTPGPWPQRKLTGTAFWGRNRKTTHGGGHRRALRWVTHVC